MLRVIAPQQGLAANLSDDAECKLRQFQEIWGSVGGDRDAALLVTLLTLCGGLPPWTTITHVGNKGDVSVDRGWRIDETEQRNVVTEFLAHGADFNRTVKAGWPAALIKAWKGTFDEDSPLFAATRTLLLNTRAIHLERVIDLDRLREAGADLICRCATGMSAENGAVTWVDGISWSDPRSLRTWIWYEGPQVLERLFPYFVAEPLGTLPALATGVFSEFLNTFGRFNRHHPLSFEKADASVRAAFRPFFDHFDFHFGSGIDDSPQTRALWLTYFRITFDGDPQSCPPVIRKRALAFAGEDLARMRQVFHAATQPGDTSEARAFGSAQLHFDNCCLVLARHGSIWHCLKPLLLGMRALNTACVATDLRFWVEPALEPPPGPWNHLPNMMAAVVHIFAGTEQQTDSDLTALREQFASFCLERLTDRLSEVQRKNAGASRARSDEDFVERVPVWRFCLVRAIADLRANPMGRGHRTLHWSSENDPNETVRKAAQQAYDTIRHTRGLPARVSPRRAVMSALWWLRQAHLLGLGIQPDRDLAQRTREKELTRTKESERAAAPPDAE
ncbi:MAG: hypothetical protein HZB39_18540 [Planctomycetes bacterium]|nr:hypothetical protein [Planctomycetota bacterium]